MELFIGLEPHAIESNRNLCLVYTIDTHLLLHALAKHVLCARASTPIHERNEEEQHQSAWKQCGAAPSGSFNEIPHQS